MFDHVAMLVRRKSGILNRWIRYFVISGGMLSLSLLLMSCAQFELDTSDREFSYKELWHQQIIRLMDQQNYRKALQLFDSQSVKAQSQSLIYRDEPLTRVVILSEAKMKVTKALDAADVRVEELHWKEAFKILNDTKSSVPAIYHDRIENRVSELLDEYENQRQEVAVEAKIKYGQWISKQVESYDFEVLNTLPWQSLWVYIKRDYYIGKENHLARSLLAIAEDAVATEDYLLANRIYGTMSKFKLKPKYEERYVQLGYQLLERVEFMVAEMGDKLPEDLDRASGESALQPKVDKQVFTDDKKNNIDQWIVHARKMIREGRLIEIKRLLNRLSRVSLSRSQRKQVASTKRYLRDQTELLDKHADNLYSKGKIKEAHSIWALLRKLDNKNEEIRLKYNRSSRVLGNMQHLRQEGYFSED